jgi:hypothetical protein
LRHFFEPNLRFFRPENQHFGENCGFLEEIPLAQKEKASTFATPSEMKRESFLENEMVGVGAGERKIFFALGIAGENRCCNFAIPFGFSGRAGSKKASSLTSYSREN